MLQIIGGVLRVKTSFFQLILHPSAFLSRYDDNLEEAGSGDDDIFSGSGESPISDLSEVYVDDEDFNIRQRPLQVGFLCEVMMTSYTPEQVCIYTWMEFLRITLELKVLGLAPNSWGKKLCIVTGFAWNQR